MSEDRLHHLARQAGIATEWTDAFGQHHDVSPDTLRLIMNSLGLATTEAERPSLPALVIADVDRPIRIRRPAAPASAEKYRVELESGAVAEGTAAREGDMLVLPRMGNIGYHKLEIGSESAVLAVVPPRCFTIADIETSSETKLWGTAAPAYALRRAGDGGIGDFTGVAQCASAAAALGAAAFIINPVHALFSATPEHFSPYAPSSRIFLNPLYADPAEAFGSPAVARAMKETGLGPEFAALEALALIDWPAAGRAKMKLLRRLFDLNEVEKIAAGESLAAFRRRGGEALEDHARFETLRGFLGAEDPAFHDWRNWTGTLRNPRGQDVADFAQAHAGEVTFHIFLQWLADRSMAAAQKTCRDAGMPIGLVADLAVGTDAAGSHAWSRQQEMLSGLSVGAPPDHFNINGQSWGVVALSPRSMQVNGYRAFIETLRATMAHAGGLRIDHVMGLARLWVVPDGASPLDGTYIRYPLHDLFRLVALESWRNRAIVLGEDLGTVEEGFRGALYDAGILGMQVMLFERDPSGFFSPYVYSDKAIATTTTHDLPTIAGWWAGTDIDDRRKAGLVDEADVENERQARRGDREALWRTMKSCDAAMGEAPEPSQADVAVDAATALIAKTPSPLAILPLSDVLALPDQANMPGTTDEYPNWRVRLPGMAKDILDDPGARGRLSTLSKNRPKRT